MVYKVFLYLTEISNVDEKLCQIFLQWQMKDQISKKIDYNFLFQQKYNYNL